VVQNSWILRFRLALAALAYLGLGTLTPADQMVLKSVALLDCSGLPCIELSVDSGKTVKLLVDTGNLRSILDQGAAERLGLALEPYVGRDGKVHPGYSSATLKGVKLGGAGIGDLAVMVVNLGPSVAKGDMPAADGTLTYAAFDRRLLRLDYKHHRVEISEILTQGAPCPTDCGVLTTPTFGQGGPPVVVTTGFSVNQRPVVVQVDTLYAGTMLIYPSSVDKLGLAAAQNSQRLRKFPFTDGGVEMIEGLATTEGFGKMTLRRNPPLYFATAEVHTPDGMFDGTVGQQLFAGHMLTFDFFAHHFWIS